MAALSPCANERAGKRADKMTDKIAILILAAGAATRFGSAKQLLVHNGKSLLQHCIDRANAVSPGHVYVVLGANHDHIQPTVSASRIVLNRDWRSGLGSSIAAGVRSLEQDYAGVLILLADQAEVDRDDLDKLVGVFDGERTVAAYYAGKCGVPALFPKSLFPHLAALSGDSGAKTLLNQPVKAVLKLDLPCAAMDIDSPEDWVAFNARS